MPTTFQALGVLVLALLPGAAFFYAVEWHTGAWGAKASDRVLRFVVLSTWVGLLALPAAYWLWRRYVLSGHLATAKPFPWPLYGALLVYLLVPAVAGFVLGHLLAGGNDRVIRILGRQIMAPRAFDYVFGANRRQVAGWVRILLKEPHSWIAGTFETTRRATAGRQERHSYVSAYPEDPPDIYLARTARVNRDTGEFLLDVEDKPVLLDVGMLVNSSNIAYLEFIER